MRFFAFIAVLLLSLIGTPALAATASVCASPEILVQMDQAYVDAKAPEKHFQISLLLQLDGTSAMAFIGRYNHAQMDDQVVADTVLLLSAVSPSAGPSTNLHVFFLKDGCVVKATFIDRPGALGLAGKEA